MRRLSGMTVLGGVLAGLLFLLLIPSCRMVRELMKGVELPRYMQVRRSPELKKTEIRSIAVLPMIAPPIAKADRQKEDLLCSFCGRPVAEHRNFREAGERISSYLYEDLRKVAPYRVISPEKVHLRLAVEKVPPERYRNLTFIKRFGRELGADVLVVGEVLRVRERRGGRYSVVEPASISFRLVLYRVKDGREIFSVDYDETQRPLNEEPQRFFHPSRIRFRWQTAEELARAAVKEVVKVFPGVQPAP
ncbi:MAG: hypothetical protein GXP58_00130 [Deltaproteobacteria bacterium]|nr:hypothetical protein [Deltaproteobacteria bacterium]